MIKLTNLHWSLTIKSGLLALLLLSLLTISSCIEEEEEPAKEATEAEIKAEIKTALSGGATIVELLETYSKTQLYGVTYRGGIIAYINETNKEGLVISSSNISTDSEFSSTAMAGDFSTYSTYGRGSDNTMLIVNEIGTSGNAAALCYSYSTSGYSDWFLPSTTELEQIRSAFRAGYIELPGGQTNAGYYWSSTISGGCSNAKQMVTGTNTPCASKASVRAAQYFYY